MQPNRSQSTWIWTAWAITLAASLLPDILFRELSGSAPAWLFWVKGGLISAALIFSLAWKKMQPLRMFFFVLCAVYWLSWGVEQLAARLDVSALLAYTPPFIQQVGRTEISRVTTALLLALLMFLVFGGWKKFFLTRGKLDAPAAPIPLITSRPVSWLILGPCVAAAMSLGLVVFSFVFGSLPSAQAMARVAPLLPFVLLFALGNSFGEEMIYRAPWLAALESPVGAGHALGMTAVYFGIGHYYGVPYGITGVVMACIPGWLMGKAMLETRGFAWAWLIHLCMDLTIFFLMALGSVSAGGA